MRLDFDVDTRMRITDLLKYSSKTVTATLAAAIVTARGAVEVVDIQEAWSDAHHIVHPNRRHKDYLLWCEKNGLDAHQLDQSW